MTFILIVKHRGADLRLTIFELFYIPVMMNKYFIPKKKYFVNRTEYDNGSHIFASHVLISGMTGGII